MVFFNYATMQMAAKIVYYGPGLCGKTTNLHYIYAKTSPMSRGEMVSLETETDRTLFFDLLPIDVGVIGGFKTRLQLYTIPGQVFYNTTRKLVLKGVDGIVFVADSQVAMQDANVESFSNLRENLAEIGLKLDDMTGEDVKTSPRVAAQVATFRVKEPQPAHDARATAIGTAPAPKVGSVAVQTPEEIERRQPSQGVAEAAPTRHAFKDSTLAKTADVDSRIISDVPVAAPAPPPTPEPEIEFSQAEKPAKEPKVKHVKVRSSVDVMAELEALRKRATQTTPKQAKKEVSPLDALMKTRDVQKTISLKVNPDTLTKTKSVRVAVSFENREGVVQHQEQTIELGDASDAKSLTVNLKINS
jgi:hypothetical protein